MCKKNQMISTYITKAIEIKKRWTVVMKEMNICGFQSGKRHKGIEIERDRK